MTFVGRQDEAQLLLQAYKRVLSCPANESAAPIECVLISGHSGTGKTALVQSMLPRFQDGFFLTAKFELTKLQNPFATIVTAFTQFVNSILSSDKADKELDLVRNAVQDGLEGLAKYLTNVIPALEKLTGPQDCIDDINGNHATTLFHQAFCKLCHALSAIAPLVFFFDDLQWSDTSTLELLQSLLGSRPNPNDNFGILVVMSYRDEDVYDEWHKSDTSKGMRLPFFGYLRQFQDISTTPLSTLKLTEIKLTTLDEPSINQLVAGLLGAPADSTVHLASMIYTHCKGNPFFATQMLKLLIGQGKVRQSTTTEEGWQWDDHEVVKACSSTAELVRRKLMTLSPLAQEAFQVAACMGDEIDEGALAIVLGKEIPEFELHIQAGQAEGLVDFQRYLGRFRFSHDRIRQVVLSTIEDKNERMYRVGYLLWTKSLAMFLAQKIFLIASLLNHAPYIMTDQAERYRAAALNLEAGIKAAALSAFPDSSRYLAAGMEYLRGGDFWKEQYDLTLNMFSTAVDTAVCSQNFDRVAQLVGEVLKHGRTLQDKLRAHAAQINSLGQRGMLQEAVDYGVVVLKQLGQPLPQKATTSSVVYEVVKTKFALRGMSDEDLMMLPPMSDPTVLAAIHFMSILLPYTYQSASNYNPLLCTRIVRMCLKHGYHKACLPGFTAFGWMLCGSGNTKKGYRLGRLALLLTDKARAREMIPRVFLYFYGFINHWRNPLRSSLEHLDKAVQIGIEVGDVEYAMIALNFKCTSALSSGVALSQVEDMMIDACRQMTLYKQELVLQTMKLSLQFIHNMTGRAPDRMVLSGEVLKVYNPSKTSRVNWIVYHFLTANLAFGFGDYELALRVSKDRQVLAFKPTSLFVYVNLRQMDALIAIAYARQNPCGRKYAIKVGKRVIKEMKVWAADCPQNFLFRQKMVEAELLSLKPHKSVDPRIHASYCEALEGMSREGFMAEAGLFTELFGNYLNRQGEEAQAQKFWRDAHAFYLKWGATERAKYLLERHPSIL